MKHGKDFLHTIAAAAALDAEPLPGLPLVEIVDWRRVLVENHRGIIGYGCGEICIKLREGCITVCGECLNLSKMSKVQLVITGSITSVNYRKGRTK